MTKREMIAEMREILARDAQRPAKERWNELVARGAIDAEGRVLLRGPGHDPAPKATPSPRKPRRQKAR